MEKKQSKKQYLTPAVKTVAFKVEQGFAGSPDKVITFNPTAGSTAQYQELNDNNFLSDFEFINQ